LTPPSYSRNIPRMITTSRCQVCLVFLGDIRYDGRSHNIVTSLVRSGYRVTIVGTGAGSVRSRFLGADVYSIRLHRGLPSKLRFLEFYLRATARVIRIPADLYQAEDLFSLPVAWLGALFHGGRLSYDCRELYFALGSLVGRPRTQAFWSLVERTWIVKTDLVMITAANQREILQGRYGIKPPIVVRNHPPRSSRPGGPSPLRKDLGIPAERRVLLYQGTLNAGRGIFLPLEIIRRIEGSVMVYLAFGELKSALLSRARDYGLDDRVFIRGPIPYSDLLAYTAGADVGLALQEPFGENHLRARPNKVFEYIMAGVPVVASDFPPLRKVVLDRGVGLVVDVEDMEDVVTKVRRLLDDRALYDEMRRNCDRAAREFNWENEEASLLPALSGLLSTGNDVCE